MRNGYVDSASIWGVIAAMSYSRVEEWPEWTKQSAIEVTHALVNDHYLEIAPGPGSFAGAMGLYDHAMRNLAFMVSDSVPAEGVLKHAETRLRKWVSRYHASISAAFGRAMADENMEDWLGWAIPNSWVWHSAMLEGLFNQGLVPQLALVLGRSEDELHDAWERSCDLKQVKDWAKRQPDSDDFSLVRDAYVLAALLRGRFHDHFAEAADLQIMHHPFRYSFLPKKSETAIVVPTNTEKYFTSIILASAFAERTAKGRIALWAENVAKARRANKEGDIDLRHKPSNRRAEEKAVRAAKSADLTLHSRTAAAALDVILALAQSLTWFGLFSWAGFPPSLAMPMGPAGSATTKLQTGKSPGEIAASLVYRRRLSSLSHQVPGRIKGRWD
jgi:hypothetical protein